MPSHDQLTAAHRRLLADIRARLTDYATTLWAGLGSWRDSDIERFVELMLPRVLAGRRQVARLTDAYIAQLAGSAAAGVIDLAAIRGIPDADVYRRPAKALYGELAEGKALDIAQTVATTRLIALIATDMQMTQVRQAQRTMRNSGVQFYRRVLGGGGDCALCMIASTQRYRKSDLMPIHPRCGCTVAPIQGDANLVLDPDLLEHVHSEVQRITGEVDRGARSSAYRKLIAAREHGEMGPVLTWKHQQFTSAADIAA